MKIINLSFSRHISTKKINALLSLLPKKIQNSTIPIYFISNPLIYAFLTLKWGVFQSFKQSFENLNTISGYCLVESNNQVSKIVVFTNFIDKEFKCINIYLTLMHEIRHFVQYNFFLKKKDYLKTTMKYHYRSDEDNQYSSPYSPLFREEEEDANMFAMNFFNKHKKFIKNNLGIEFDEIKMAVSNELIIENITHFPSNEKMSIIF